MNRHFFANVTEVIFKRGRFFVRVECEGRKATIPRAVHIWLQSNPAFSEIPKGYVVHHLDHDETNDDPSNLVIMQKHQHTAHHLKQIRINPELTLATARRVPYCPTTYPKVYQHKKKFFIQFYQRNEYGKGQTVKVWSRDGKNFSAREEADNHAKEIWESAMESTQIEH